MKKLFKGLVVTAMVGLGFLTGMNVEKQKETKNVAVESILFESTDNFYVDQNETIITLTDGSFLSFDTVEKEYNFQPVELGDWDYECKTADELMHLVTTYTSIKNDTPANEGSEKIEIKEIEQRENGDLYTEYTDGSWSLESENEFIFQPVELCDWDYQLNSKEELENIINTYLELKNN